MKRKNRRPLLVHGAAAAAIKKLAFELYDFSSSERHAEPYTKVARELTGGGDERKWRVMRKWLDGQGCPHHEVFVDDPKLRYIYNAHYRMMPPRKEPWL